MDIYTVIDESIIKRINLYKFKSLPINYLIQFRKDTYKYMCTFRNSKLLVDSGAFYFNFLGRYQNPEKTNEFIQNYYDFVLSTSDDERIQGYFDMDLSYIGLNQIKRIRRNLFNYSDKIIPVYHTIWGLNEFKRMCKRYDYIALGCSNNVEIPSGEYHSFIKYAHKYNCKVHGLGLNSNIILKKVPFDSCDSVLWLHEGFKKYYFDSNIEKNKENNKKYRPLFEQEALITQYKRQLYFKEYWNEYDKLKS